MKVLHCAETIKGGVATVLKQIALAQISSSDFSHVICMIPDTQSSELNEVPATNLCLYRRSGRNISSFWQFAKRFISILLKEKPDVVHIHSTFAGFMARLILMVFYPIRQPAVIYCPHAFAFLMEGSGIKKNLYVYIEKFLSLITDKIICVSQFEYEAAKKLGISPSKMAVVHNGVPVREGIDKHYSHDTLNLLFVGRLDFQKGYDLLVTAMREISDESIHLTIVGDSVNGETEKVPLKNITYTGWVKSTEIERYFVNADALVIPSRWEGFAMVPLEAMSYGLPVISSDSTSFPEVVKDQVTGYLFKNGDAEELKEKILALKESDLNKLGSEGNKVFREHFSSQAMIDKTFSLYQIVLS
ncbi:glycosyltransferase [Pantoea sp. B65]|uniref:glycosyltransferase n=1 Tax=Pantoea sp. B65 TaxID=2813359 RepID=UPI0039B3C7E1